MKIETQGITEDQRYAAVVEKLTLLGVRVPPRGAWKKTMGRMAGSQHLADATRLGAEWRDEMNRQSIEELNAHP